MPIYRIMSYNIRHMNKMFQNNQIRPTQVQRAQDIAQVINAINPDLIGISEAANDPQEHAHFIQNYLGGTYNLAAGVSRGAQNLVFYYRAPFRQPVIDDSIGFYDPWDMDVDEDHLKEHHLWDRKPLEVIFRIGAGGPRIRFILVHTKSKGIFYVVDLADYQKIAQANRTRLIGQALRLRERLETLMSAPNALPLVVMGDMNDGPGLDAYEKTLGSSFVETVMGRIYYPDRIFHNTLYWMTQGTSQQRNELYTADFPDPIVRDPFGRNHRVWIDHILVSPDMLVQTNQVRYVPGSGAIGVKDQTSRNASDHFAIWCQIQVP